MTPRDQIFISYSHQDHKWLARLETQLTPYRRNHQELVVWADTRIRAGTLWHEEIKQALARARVALLLVSGDFLASDFIHTQELPPLLDAARAGGLTILWVPVGPCGYAQSPIAAYQAVLDPSRPLSLMPKAKAEAALVAVCQAIERAFTMSQTTQPTAPAGRADRGAQAAGGSGTAGDILSALFHLDRMAQWGKLHEATLAGEHVYFVLHGEQMQDLKYFCRRIHRVLRTGSDRVVDVPYRVERRLPTSASAWALRLRDALAGSLACGEPIDLGILLCELLRRERLFLVLEIPWSDAFGDEHRQALRDFLVVELPRYVHQAAGALPVRVLIAAEYVPGKERRHEAIEAFLTAALNGQVLPDFIRYRPLPEVTIHAGEVEDYLLEQVVDGERLHRQHPLFAEAIDAYRALRQGCFSFRALAETIDHILGR